MTHCASAVRKACVRDQMCLQRGSQCAVQSCALRNFSNILSGPISTAGWRNSCSGAADAGHTYPMAYLSWFIAAWGEGRKGWLYAFEDRKTAKFCLCSYPRLCRYSRDRTYALADILQTVIFQGARTMLYGRFIFLLHL